ncbi:MAG TPA: polysaccharide biosynthesis protein [Bacilli bacterium]|jgi:UDP-N-acetylglucosamine 4,6-dehydratase|nr:polysaccharide biosynthesis protein [Bacilli bacterium]HPY79827.1 polysaccharide biosynthesis protein [Bacilli bacterium]HQA55737.1 polysaccharide biosynthesis protein [Bacilli bacterium]
MKLREIRKKCKLTQKEASEVVGMPLRTYVMYENEEANVDQLKLERAIEKLQEHASHDTGILKDKVLLITGGTGSFGHAVVDRFLTTDIKQIRILSRDEKKQDDMRKSYNNDKLKFYIGDVRDYNSIKDAFKGVDYVFSAAALKQVPSCEFFPIEAVKTNVIGSDNVITACVENHVKKAIFLSTDKAAYPINAMGISKALMEKNVIARSRQLLAGDTILCLTRYGNVMASRGSVIPLFLQQINSAKPITITNPEMTRFMMTLEDAVNLVLYAFETGKQGDLFVQKAPAATIETLARAIIDLTNSKTGVEYIGTRHGEKLYETLVTQEEMLRAEDLGNFFRIYADNRDLNYDKYFSEGIKHIDMNESYTSHNTDRLDNEGMKKLLKKLQLFGGPVKQHD